MDVVLYFDTYKRWDFYK